MIKRLIVGAVILGLAGHTMAAVVTPNSATSSTSGTDFRSVNNLINDSGLDASDPQNHILAGTGYDQSWVTTGFTGDYYNSGPIPVLTYDLGADTAMDTIFVWSYGGTTGAGTTFQGNAAKDFTLRFATASDGAGGFGTSIPTSLNFTTVPPPGSNQASSSAIPRDDLSFSQVITARYVEMTITDNYWGVAGSAGGDRVGLGEVKFNAIPEPSSLALLGLSALPLVLLGLRRFRR